MKLGFERFIKRGQKGVTLVELMVVMAILAVLAAIIFPAVSGTQEVSVDSQTRQDASTVSNALADYFADQTGAEIITSANTSILATATNQSISSRWAENFTTTVYPLVFAANNTIVTAINILDEAGNSTINVTAFVNERNAINLQKLADQNYIPAVPKNASDKAGNFNNYLWVVKKSTAIGGVSGASREIEVFKLTGVVQTGNTSVLNYRQLY